MHGYYRLHRRWMNHGVFEEERFCKRAAWVYLMEHAAWDDTTFFMYGRQIPIARGQFATRYKTLATQWRWTKQQVSEYLHKLQSAGMIQLTGVTNSPTSPKVITICNYNELQFSSDKLLTSKRQTQDKPSTHAATYKEKNKEQININNESKGDLLAIFSAWQLQQNPEVKTALHKPDTKFTGTNPYQVYNGRTSRKCDDY